MSAPNDIIVLPRSSPDLDGIACAVAYSEYLQQQGKRAAPWFSGDPDAEALYVLERCEGVTFADASDVVLAREYVLVDASGLEGLPEEVDPTQVIEVIDHRLHHKADAVFPNAKLQIEPVGAAATQIAERFNKHGVTPSLASGMLLYGAIYSNTQCLRGSVTTDRDRAVADWLHSVVSIPKDLLDGQFSARRTEILRDLASAIQKEQKSYSHPTGDYVVAQLEFMGASQLIHSDLNKIVSYILKGDERTMLNLVDVETGSSYLIVPDASLRSTVAAVAKMDFEGIVAESKSVVLRKQIVAAMEGIAWEG